MDIIYSFRKREIDTDLWIDHGDQSSLKQYSESWIQVGMQIQGEHLFTVSEAEMSLSQF